MSWVPASRGSSAGDLARRYPGPYVIMVLSRLPRALAGRFWAIMLVLTIAVSAVVPGAAPLTQRSGSAFAADTVEMVVAPARTQATVTCRVELPPVPVLPTVQAEACAPTMAVPGQVLAKPHATGPPLSALALLSAGTPRAPPAA
jgi:hypothetical protein